MSTVSAHVSPPPTANRRVFPIRGLFLITLGVAVGAVVARYCFSTQSATTSPVAVLTGDRPLVSIGATNSPVTHTIDVMFGSGKGDHPTLLVLDHPGGEGPRVQHLYGYPARIDLRFEKGSFAASGHYTLVVLDGDFPRVTLSVSGEDLLRVQGIDVLWDWSDDPAKSVVFTPDIPAAAIRGRIP